MRLAIEQASMAQQKGEVPVGAVLVQDDQLIASGYNQPISSCDPSAHAEMVALREGAKKLNNYRLVDTTLYVTLEPCLMCTGLLIHARVKTLIFGAYDPKVGAITSTASVLQMPNLNHNLSFTGGVLEDECSKVLTEFFKKKRSS